MEEFVEIPVGKGLVTIVDPEFADLIGDRWSVTGKSGKHPYISKGVTLYRIIDRKKYRKTLYLHRIICKIPPTEANTKIMVDHINGNTLDNRRCNLRPCTRSENLQNSVRRGGKYKGVRNSHDDKWSARITIGCFDSAEDAAHAYNEAAKYYFGDFARLNVLPEGYVPKPRSGTSTT